uniref:Restin n=2 Tax=Anthurium amnicola TaxID=1678845 RepID=A0A1D1Z2R2_9ARAE
MAVDPPDEPAKEEEKKVEEGQASDPSSGALPGSPSGEEIKAVARTYADQPLQNPDPGAWAVLTAISKNARQRPQGMNIILNGDEHFIGRLVEDHGFRISDVAVSSTHCRIYRRRVRVSDAGHHDPVFLKDTSTNGTFVNSTKLKKSSPETVLQHGDIISFLGPPHEERAYAFVYREVSHSVCSKGSVMKRKSVELASESKRVKGIGIGAPDGPISLDDVRSLQRSNMELRKQLESHVLTIDNMRTEARIAVTCHENEIKGLKESISDSYLDQIKELQHMLEVKEKELDDINVVSAEHRHSIKDLSERLSASMQSRAEADEFINTQKLIISEREAQLDEERNQRRVEREKAAADLKSALQRAHSEAQEEIKRQADIHLQQHNEQQEFIAKLQESEKESRLLVETLRSKLEDTRESLVMSEKKARQLEVQVQEEQITSENNKKKSEMLELEIKRLKKDLESEKVAREEAWAKVSALELEIASVIRELSIEKQRFQGARERIILRETQLRAFYSTTEEISLLFAKQQEQLKAMQKTLEDEENYDNASMGFDLNVVVKEDDIQALAREGETSGQPKVNIYTKDTQANPSSKMVQAMDSSSSNDDASVTEKHECDIRSQDVGDYTQDLECTSADRPGKGFGSDVDGVGTALVPEGVGDAADTERVPETESPAVDDGFDERSAALLKCNQAGDTMQLEDDAQENIGHIGILDGNDHYSQSKLEDTEAGTVRTADLLASEGIGSWANSTAPSVHGENESPGCGANAGPCGDVGAEAAVLSNSDVLAAGSQSNVVLSGITPRLTEQHRALNAMIEIVAPNFKEQFPSVGSGEEKNDSMSDAETEEGTDHGDEEDDSEEESNRGVHAMIEDSVG